MRRRAGRGGLLHAGGDVDGDAADAAVGIDPAAEQHAAGVHADADVEAGVAVGWTRTSAPSSLPSSSRARPQRTARSASSSRDSSAPKAASMLSPAYCSTLPRWACDDGGAARQGTVHHGADGFGVEVLGERGRADDVEEQDADLLERLGGFGRGRRRRSQCGQLGLERRQRRVDHRVTEQTALGLQGLDPGLELLLFGRHPVRSIPTPSSAHGPGT